jgi:hypothetical protein
MVPPLRCSLLCLVLTALPARASPLPAERGEISRRADDEVEQASPERLGLARVDGSAIDGPGVLGLLTALSVSFVYARRTRRPR